MALLHISPNDIDEKQLRRLIDAKIAESRDIEYKRDTYGNGDADHAEWLADVSSFANTVGGDIIIGMEAKSGVPVAIAPLTIDVDKEILRLEDIARSNVQPRIAHLQCKSIALAGGGHVLLVRVPRSYNPPHRIVRVGKGQNRFWSRSSAGKYEPNVDELRTLFTLAPQLTDRIRDFRFNRIARIVAGDAPVQLLDKSCLIIHIVPFSAFDPGALVSPAEIEKGRIGFPPIGSNSITNWRINFDGVLLPSNAQQTAPSQRAYTQIFRSGAIEAVASSITSGERPQGVGPRLLSIRVEGMILSTLVRYLKSINAQGVEPPFAVMVSLIGMKSVSMNVGTTAQWHDDDDMTVLDRDQFHFGEVILDKIPNSIQECGVLIRPIIEQIANTAGRAASASFGPNGDYVHLFQ